MDIDELIVELQKLQSEGKGKYKVRAHNINFNEASGGNLYVYENEEIGMGRVYIEDDTKTITFVNITNITVIKL